MPGSLRELILYGGPYHTIKAGAESTLRGQKKEGEWLSLRDWGFDLQSPGHYTLLGVPDLANPHLTPDTTVRSNKVTFTITP
jgi:hypothetical protein